MARHNTGGVGRCERRTVGGIDVEVIVHVAGEDEVDVRKLQDALERFAPEEDPESIHNIGLQASTSGHPSVGTHVKGRSAKCRAGVMQRSA